MDDLEKLDLIENKKIRIDNLKEVIKVLRMEINEILAEVKELEKVEEHRTIWFQYGKWDPKKVKDEFGGAF